MGVTYFKRYRMDYNLAAGLFTPPVLPPFYRLVPWNNALLETHADVKFHSFRQEVDAHVFPCFNEREACWRLMNDIAQRPGFLPQSTWLVAFQPRDRLQAEFCGTIQGLRDDQGVGAIQNVGITPAHRGQGLGSILLYWALDGFKRVGLSRCFLEVTANNAGAVRLYKRLGFRRIRTVYKAAEVAYA